MYIKYVECCEPPSLYNKVHSLINNIEECSFVSIWRFVLLF